MDRLAQAFLIIDSLPVPVCRFPRAAYCQRLRASSAYGHDEVALQRFFGTRIHLRIAWPGVIAYFEQAPANVHELTVAEQLPG